MALDILPIQASAVPCEHVFFSSMKTCESQCSRIEPTLMEALQILKYHIQQEESLDFTKGLSQAEEEKEIETEMLRSEMEPENMQTLLTS